MCCAYIQPVPLIPIDIPFKFNQCFTKLFLKKSYIGLVEYPLARRYSHYSASICYKSQDKHERKNGNCQVWWLWCLPYGKVSIKTIRLGNFRLRQNKENILPCNSSEEKWMCQRLHTCRSYRKNLILEGSQQLILWQRLNEISAYGRNY